MKKTTPEELRGVLRIHSDSCPGQTVAQLQPRPEFRHILQAGAGHQELGVAVWIEPLWPHRLGLVSSTTTLH
jgi:hypothetical protein